MRLVALTLAALVWAAAPARADGDVGVVVTGDATMQPAVLAMVEGWLRAHGHQLVASPLPPEATNKLIDCFVIEDTACARRVVEGQAKTSTVVFARVEVADTDGGMRDVTITAYWFDRGSEPVAEKRTCEKCTDGTLRSTGDAVLAALAGSAHMTVGQLALTSTPSGARVAIDGVAKGTTPVSIALAPGEHRVTLTGAGRQVERRVTIAQGETASLEIPLGGGGAHRSKLPLALIGAGGAILVTGVVLFATSESDTGEKREYRDTKALGAGVAAGGLVIAGIGTYLWLAAGKPADSAPAVALGPHGAYVGWGAAF